MKKFLLSLAAVFTLGVAAQAETVDLTASTIAGGLSATTTLTENAYTASGFSFTFKKATGETVPAFNKDGDIRTYAKNTIDIASSNGNITDMVFTISKKGKYRLTDITASAGTITINAPKTTDNKPDGEWTVTWTGDAANVTLTVGDFSTYGTDGATKAGQFDFDKVAITTGAGGGPVIENAAAPVFSPAAGTTFGNDGLAVTITAADGAKIYYTLDGTVPTDASDLYAAPIALTETTTVKAIAYEEGKTPSRVVEATYTYQRPIEAGEGEVLFDLTSISGIDNGEYVESLTQDGVTVTFLQNGNQNGPKWYKTGTAVRVYNKNQLKIEAQREIETVTFTYDVYNGTTYSFKGNITDAEGKYVTVTPGTLAEDGDQGVWTLGATEGTLEALGTSGQARIKSIAVVLKQEGPVTPTAAMPTILPATGTTFGESLEVSITAAEGAKVYYTLDGTTPTAASTLYTAPFTITETTTVKAMATEEGKNDSRIVTATYTLVETINTLQKIIDLGLEDETTEFTYGGTATVVYQNGSNLYIKDESASLLVYGSGLPTYTAGDRITGFRGKFKNYYCTYELMATAASFLPGTPGEPVNPVVTDLEEVTADMQNSYIELRNVKVAAVADSEKDFTLTAVNDADLPAYNKFGIEFPTDDRSYNVKGFVSYYQAQNKEPKVQIYPISFEVYNSGIEAVAADALDVVVAGRNIIAPQGAQVYSINGTRVAATDLAAGIYVVRFGNKAVKVMVK